MALSPGTRLGPYEILAPLGAGGMGEVYRARDPRLDREVAIKVLPEEVATDPDRLRRFEKEAKAAAALDHTNILDVHDIGTHDGFPYVVTELLEGESLREGLRKGGITIRKAVEYAVQIARGLAAAHDKGIVHRDLKPENLFVTKNGLVKILDFGLAKLMLRERSGEEASNTASVSDSTEPGAVLGTVGYMSPEQVRGRAVDHRSDVFSFGTLLYEMLAGRHPFRGETPAETMTAILRQDPQELSGLPPALTRIVSSCLEKKPDERLQSVRDLPFHLESVSAPAPPRPTKRRWPPVALVVVAAVVAAAGYSWLRWERELPALVSDTPAERKKLVVLPFENLGPPEDAYFAAGMTEEITNRLARVSGLGVISRTSAVQYDRTGKTIRQIGSDLGVGFVLAGSVRWERRAEGPGRVRISPQLIRVTDDTHLWASSYDRVLDDIFAVQSEIAEAVVGRLGVALLPAEQRAIAARPTKSLKAHQAYLRGLEYFWDPDLAKESHELAIRMFERAVGHDPAFVAAHSLLSETHSSLYWFGYDRSPECLEAAREAALRALDLDPDSPEGHRALGTYHYYGHRDYRQAIEEFRLAAKRLPNDTLIAAYIGVVRRRQGSFHEGIAGLEKALGLDPRNALLASAWPTRTGSFASTRRRIATTTSRSLSPRTRS